MTRFDPNMSYFDWLKSQVEYFTDRGTHEFLFRRLHDREFYAVLENDNNRISDAMRLRDEYYGRGMDGDIQIDGPCSMLEFLVALARRMSFIYSLPDEDRTADCFWTMIRNLFDGDMSDDEYAYRSNEIVVEQIIDRFLERAYESDGYGGLFPLDSPRGDQRNVEIWYQMNQYLNEVMTREGRV